MAKARAAQVGMSTLNVVAVVVVLLLLLLLLLLLIPYLAQPSTL